MMAVLRLLAGRTVCWSDEGPSKTQRGPQQQQQQPQQHTASRQASRQQCLKNHSFVHFLNMQHIEFTWSLDSLLVISKFIN